MGTLYVSDLDGTLLGPQGRLSARCRRGLAGLIDRGLLFTVASARSVVSMQGALGALPLRLPVICFNGGFTSDYQTGVHLRVEALADTEARTVHALARALGLEPIVSTHTPDGDRMYVPEAHNDGVGIYVADRRRHQDPRLRLVVDPSVGLGEQVTCLTVIARRPQVEAIEAAIVALMPGTLQLHVSDDMYTVGWTWLTVHGGRAQKGRAVRELMREQGLQARRLVVFGDQLNDLTMFAEADHAVAPANAHPEVRAAADEVIGHHADDAVLDWLLARSREGTRATY